MSRTVASRSGYSQEPEVTGWDGASWAAPARIGWDGGITAYAMDNVWVLDTVGGVSDVVDDLVHAVRWALAENPRGVICNLSGIAEAAELEPRALCALSALGWYAADWPAVPIIISCTAAGVRAAVQSRPGGEHLKYTAGVQPAWSEVAGPNATTAALLRMPPHPVAIRASRQFLIRTCLDWQFQHAVTAGGLLVTQLVSNVLSQTLRDIEVSLVRHDQRLRAAVRYGAPPTGTYSYQRVKNLYNWQMPLVDTFASCSGELPAADGSRVLWAVLDA